MSNKFEQEIKQLTAYISQNIPITEKFQEGGFDYDNPVDVCMDAVLSIRRKYNAFVIPRLENFRENYPNITTLKSLSKMIADLGPEKFCTAWNYNHPARVEMLESLTQRFLKYNEANNIQAELEGMQHWANSVSVLNYQDFGVKGIGLATFQYLRMLLGVQTVKPDVHIKKACGLALNRTVNDLEAIELIEQVSKQLGLPATVVDHNIWKKFAQK